MIELLDFPDEILSMIFEYLPTFRLLKLTSTCHRLHELLTEIVTRRGHNWYTYTIDMDCIGFVTIWIEPCPWIDSIFDSDDDITIIIYRGIDMEGRLIEWRKLDLITTVIRFDVLCEEHLKTCGDGLDTCNFNQF